MIRYLGLSKLTNTTGINTTSIVRRGLNWSPKWKWKKNGKMELFLTLTIKCNYNAGHGRSWKAATVMSSSEFPLSWIFWKILLFGNCIVWSWWEESRYVTLAQLKVWLVNSENWKYDVCVVKPLLTTLCAYMETVKNGPKTVGIFSWKIHWNVELHLMDESVISYIIGAKVN